MKSWGKLRNVINASEKFKKAGKKRSRKRSRDRKRKRSSRKKRKSGLVVRKSRSSKSRKSRKSGLVVSNIKNFEKYYKELKNNHSKHGYGGRGLTRCNNPKCLELKRKIRDSNKSAYSYFSE